ncbi:unnamed protein product [Gongylonema pulchrum]|uniref:MFS domain-containing protein n=1 Tax=Gongylonema pulchrum TaxID=637853 RepID=A0A183D300_9BILA|nr:unnamed protein product [Gongylonema pulchrum]
MERGNFEAPPQLSHCFDSREMTLIFGQPINIIGSCACSQIGGRRLLYCVVLLWSISTLLIPFVAPSYHMLIFSRVVLGLGEGLGLPTMYHILAQTVRSSRRSAAFSYLSAAGAVGQTFAAAVRLLFFFKFSLNFDILHERYNY